MKDFIENIFLVPSIVISLGKLFVFITVIICL